MAGLVLLSAGGTGGHLFPAQALAHELRARGYRVHLATDRRAERFAGDFPADEIHVVASATITSKNPIALMRTGIALFRGLRDSGRLLARLRPAVVVGFGGYPAFPAADAASAARHAADRSCTNKTPCSVASTASSPKKPNVVASGFKRLERMPVAPPPTAGRS